MPMMPMENGFLIALHEFRRRMYATYGQSSGEKFPQKVTAGLQARMPFLEHWVKKHFPSERDAAILDLGCGHGALMQALRAAGYINVKGVDASPVQVSLANEIGIAGVEQGDLITALERLENRSLNVVAAMDVLEHFTKPELGIIAERVWQVLKPSGRWIIHTVNGESPFAGRTAYGDITHETIFTRNSLCQMLGAYGFCKISCIEDRPVPHGLKSSLRYMLWRALRSLLMMYVAVETGDLGRHGIFSQNFTAVAYK
jgi:2-polyprenyl-3-methyl-5-hydroxy-6-metoxy-1,4-benzoquinol methylase